MTPMKAFREGAFWRAEDGTRLVWNDEYGFFQNDTTGEAYELVASLSDDACIIA